MSLRTLLLAVVVLTITIAVAFQLVQRKLSSAWFAFGVHPEVLEVVEASLADQKRLAELDPLQETSYRLRFEERRTLLSRLRVLAHGRGEIVRRYELALLAAVVVLVAATSSGYAWRQARQGRRLARLQLALADLAAGRTDLELGDSRQDLVGRISAMVEEASRAMARDRQRLASLEHLSAWQEAARRHAHEIRTPLTAARLELASLSQTSSEEERRRLEESLAGELDRLADFTRRFTSFARQPRPQPAPHDLGRLLAELAALFADAWPELSLYCSPPSRPVAAMVDPDLLRQVLVNLADNAAQALREVGRTDGELRLALQDLGQLVAVEVADDGPGVPEPLRDRLFEPYCTSRRIGEGMGLGLAIARKILLDHGGDLELVASSAAGTTFRLLLPSATPTRGALEVT